MLKQNFWLKKIVTFLVARGWKCFLSLRERKKNNKEKAAIFL